RRRPAPELRHTAGPRAGLRLWVQREPLTHELLGNVPQPVGVHDVERVRLDAGDERRLAAGRCPAPPPPRWLRGRTSVLSRMGPPVAHSSTRLTSRREATLDGQARAGGEAGVAASTVGDRRGDLARPRHSGAGPSVCPVASNSSWMSSGAPPVAASHSYDSAATRSWQLSALAIPAAAAMPGSDRRPTVFANLLIASPFPAFPPHVV